MSYFIFRGLPYLITKSSNALSGGFHTARYEPLSFSREVTDQTGTCEVSGSLHGPWATIPVTLNLVLRDEDPLNHGTHKVNGQLDPFLSLSVNSMDRQRTSPTETSQS